MKLLPVPYTEVLEQDYFPAKLTSRGLSRPHRPRAARIDTVAVASVLAAYNWPRDTDRYRRVATFIDAFFAKFPEFQKPARHAKWREANINSALEGLEALPGRGGMAGQESRASRSTTASVAIDPGIVRAQAAKAAPNDPAAQERLFQEFMEWAKSQGKR